MRFALVVSLCLSVSSVAAAQGSAPWSYEGRTGPTNWGKLDPAYRACSQGHQQSPIDIRGAHLNKSLQPIEFHYIGGSMALENNGHTVVVHVNPGSYMVANGVRYDLEQFHFHHPGEEAVKGKLTDMDVHLVHKSADGKIAVIAVRLSEDRGEPNATLATLWQHLPTQPGQTEKIGGLVNPGGLLPGDRGYWTFMGSLTAPPCTEGVQWYVMEQELSISRNQLRQFAAIYRMNERPIQDSHGRIIEANE